MLLPPLLRKKSKVGEKQDVERFGDTFCEEVDSIIFVLNECYACMKGYLLLQKSTTFDCKCTLLLDETSTLAECLCVWVARRAHDGLSPVTDSFRRSPPTYT